jgi:hypothetical protein
MPILLPNEVYRHDANMLPPGALVHDRYQVSSPVGHGGMGAVYKATDTRLQCSVALKQALARSAAGRDAFIHEAQLLAGLRHPGLPVVTDYFVDHDFQFLVMQFIPGDDFATTLRNRKKCFPLHEVLHWARLLLDVLAYLHGQQPPIVHRDVKPGNIKLTEAGEVVLLDFGLAKGRSVKDADETLSGSVAGYTPRYAALEQIEGAGTDPRSDLYALGATLYHLLTGVAPPTAVERARAARTGLRDPLQSPDALNPQIPPDVARAVVRAMALDPAGRFASAADMRKALLGGGAGESARGGGGSVEAGDRALSPVSPVLGALASQPRRIDAAAPSWLPTGHSFDLFVQVRFSDSPRLGREDWPVESRPADVQQASDVVRLAFPVNTWTGALEGAVILVKVVAPDFVVEGQPEQLVEVPPDDYSKRVGFLMRTTKAGACRINVEVYRQDRVWLGVMPVDMRVGGELARPPLRVAHLTLQVFAGGDVLQAVAVPQAPSADSRPARAAPPASAAPGMAEDPVPVRTAASAPWPPASRREETAARPAAPPPPRRLAPVPAAAGAQPYAFTDPDVEPAPAAEPEVARAGLRWTDAVMAAVVLVAVGALGAMYGPSMLRSSPTPTAPTASVPAPPAASQPAPVPARLEAGVQFTGLQFTVTNQNDVDWQDAEFQIDAGPASSPYALRVGRIPARGQVVAPANAFVTPGGRHFDASSMKPPSLVIKATIGDRVEIRTFTW